MDYKRKHRQALAECQRGIRSEYLVAEENGGGSKQRRPTRHAPLLRPATKQIFGPARSSVSGLKDADGFTTVNDSEGILDRWKSHFESHFNDHSRNPDYLLRITLQNPVRRWLCLPPSIQELNEAIN